MHKLLDFKNLNTLGIINLTPNSFSDGNNCLNNEVLIKTISNFKSYPRLVLDFGFESTAPINTPISLTEEKKRFDDFFDVVKKIDLSGSWISFDTYKISNYRYFEEQFNRHYKNCGFIFNDVSGSFDPELREFLVEKKEKGNFYYLFNNTHIPSRAHVLNHMDFTKNENIILLTSENLLHKYEKFLEIGVENKIIFDPGFGFSKSYEQNWELLNRFEDLINIFKNKGIILPWVVGISKKSFLRKSIPNSLDPFNDAEILHRKIIKDLVSKQLGHMLFRVHDPRIAF